MNMKRYSLLPKALLGGLMFMAGTSAFAQVKPSADCQSNPIPGVPNLAAKCGNANLGAYIRSVETSGGMVNFSNLNTNCGNTLTSYSDYTGTSMYTKQTAGQSVDVKITWATNNSSNTSSTLTKIYVDWNNDGSFNGTGEYIAPNFTPPAPNPHQQGTTTPTNNPLTIKVTVPGFAKEGLVRMRIITASLGQIFDPGVNYCGGARGEAEDYSFEIVNPCLPPNVISVANVDYKSGDFSWTPKLNAEFYEYIITPVDTIPFDTVSGFTFTNNTSVDVDTFQCDTKYYVMVRIICDTAGRIARDWKRSSWMRDSFTTEPCCYAPDLKFDKLDHSSVRVYWDPIQTAFGYEYAVSTTPDPPQKGHYTINTSLVQRGLSPKTTYFFHVRSRCSPTPLSDWAKVSFKTLGGLSVNTVGGAAPFTMDAYPNPVHDNLTVQLNGDISGNARLTVIDLTGKTVYNAPVKTDKVIIDAANLPSGIYIVKYTDDVHNEIMRVTKK